MAMFNAQLQSTQRDFPRSRLMLGVGIGIAFVLVGFVVFSTRLSEEGKEAHEEIRAMLQTIRRNHPGPTYIGISSVSALDRSEAPDEDDSMVNVYGGEVIIAAASVASGSNNAVMIVYPEVPTAACGNIITHVEPLFGRVIVGATTVKDLYAAAVVPFDRTSIASACNRNVNTLFLTSTD